MTFLDELKEPLLGPEPVVLRVVKGDHTQWKIMAAGSFLPTKSPAPPGGGASLLRIYAVMDPAPAMKFQMRGGTWNDPFNQPDAVPVINANPLGDSFVLGGIPEQEVVTLFSDVGLQDKLRGLDDLYLDSLPQVEDSTYQLGFDGESLAELQETPERTRALVATVEMLLLKLEPPAGGVAV